MEAVQGQATFKKTKKKKQYVNTMSAEIRETMLVGVLHFAD